MAAPYAVMIWSATWSMVRRILSTGTGRCRSARGHVGVWQQDEPVHAQLRIPRDGRAVQRTGRRDGNRKRPEFSRPLVAQSVQRVHAFLRLGRIQAEAVPPVGQLYGPA